MWMLRINMTDRSYRLEEVPEAYQSAWRTGAHLDHRPRRSPAAVPSARPQQQAVFAPGIVTGHVRTHLGTCIGRGQVPAHRHHQGVQRRLRSGPGAGCHADQGPGGGRPAAREGQVLDGLRLPGTTPASPQVEFAPADEYVGLTTQDVRFTKLFDRFGRWTCRRHRCGRRALLRQLGHRLQRPVPARHSLRGPRRAGRRDGQQGPEVHRHRPQGRARRRHRRQGALLTRAARS